MKKIIDFTCLQIKLASPEKIKSWSHGEVLKPETINYRTLKPEKDGLFCERIFGPTKDWECYCGKYKRIRYKGIICDKCGVEVTQSRVRRERMGHVKLASPVAHVWFFRGAPSKLSTLLDISPRNLEAVIYFAKYLVIDVDEKKKKQVLKNLDQSLIKKLKEIKLNLGKTIKQIKKDTERGLKETKQKIKNKDQRSLAIEEIKLKSKQAVQASKDEHSLEEERAQEIFRTLKGIVKNLHAKSLLTEEEHLKLREYKAGSFFNVEMGAEAVQKIIKTLDIQKLAAELREEVKNTTGQHHIKATKRLRVIESMKNNNLDPSWMILKFLPVIPPDLRPMVQLSGGRFATSDLNDLYRRVINRNNRLKHLINLGAPEIILRNEKRMLQEAVDALIDSANQRRYPRRRTRRQPLRSLSDMLRGKQGRFRQNLLGKRVDYSGRSVIIVGPELKLNQCGLPKEMALEMFKPFVLRELIIQGIAPNVKSAKNVLERKPPEVFDILDEITRRHPVLLNRAPTLHKLGIQAFYPVLIEGSAISIHPCVCTGYNADFDGDQMAVHVPLGKKARQEAEELMMPKHNLLKPADGSPITTPNKEMVLGVYYLTTINPNHEKLEKPFSSKEEAILTFQTKKIKLRQEIKVKVNQEIISTTVGRLLLNETLPPKIKFLNKPINAAQIKKIITQALSLCTNKEVVSLIDRLKELGFKAATASGLSVAVTDCLIIPQKDKLIKESNLRAAEIEKNFKIGLITAEEKKRLSNEIWMDTTEDIAQKTWRVFEENNPVKIIIDSGGTRASKDQVKQLAAMRGLVVDPLGKIVELPTKSNFREGLSIFEYVTSTRGSRKGLTDSALKTADAGYLTRRLVDVAHDVIVRAQNCQTKEGIEISNEGKRKSIFLKRIIGRVLSDAVKDPRTKKTLFKKGDIIDEEKGQAILKKKIKKIVVRSPLTCQTKYGICVQCYGWDLSTKELVEIGTPMGVIAAQSIGEPGTQLTMRVKHAGGIVGLDVTQGLPRVEELFEARTPKFLSPLSEIPGKATIKETKQGHLVTIKSVGIKPPEEKEYLISYINEPLVKTGDLVSAGQQLSTGNLDLNEVLKTRGLKSTQQYLIEQIQSVYESQGIPINDKHFEIVVRKMSDKVKIETPGDTPLLPGELVDKVRFQEENSKIIAEGGEPATAQIIILGITRASLHTESWLSAASFQETINILTDVAVQGKTDKLLGLKENVIIGRLIPTSKDRAIIKK